MLEWLLEFIGGVLTSILSLLTFDPELIRQLESNPNATRVSLAVAFLAGISMLIGDSVILFLNRVRGTRFLFSLLLSGVSLIVLYFLQAVVITVIGHLFVGEGPSLQVVLRGVMLATAPMLFGFLVLIPWAGPGIARFLHVWVNIVLWQIVTITFEVSWFVGLIITVIGWVAMKFMSWVFSKPVTWLGDRIWRLVTGKPSLMTGEDILAGHPFIPLMVDAPKPEVKA